MLKCHARQPTRSYRYQLNTAVASARRRPAREPLIAAAPLQLSVLQHIWQLTSDPEPQFAKAPVRLHSTPVAQPRETPVG